MGEAPPVIYLLHGGDELGTKQFIRTMQSKMGDPAMAELNTTRLEGRQFSFGELENAVSAVPFLTSRRLVVLEQPLTQLDKKTDQERFLDILERLPPSTALVIVEQALLSEKNWLLKWARSTGRDRVLVKAYVRPKDAEMSQWIRRQAQEQGCEFTYEAANLLASQVGDDNRLATQEIGKLLAYVNYQRPVEADDVELLTPDIQHGNVFRMVDAIGQQNTRQALQALHQLLSERDPLSLFGMIVRQFRLLIMAKEMLTAGAPSPEISKTLKVPGFVVNKLSLQSRNFKLASLEEIYRQLVNVDEQIKTGKVDAAVALDTLIVGLARQS